MPRIRAGMGRKCKFCGQQWTKVHKCGEPVQILIGIKALADTQIARLNTICMCLKQGNGDAADLARQRVWVEGFISELLMLSSRHVNVKWWEQQGYSSSALKSLVPSLPIHEPTSVLIHHASIAKRQRFAKTVRKVEP